MKALGDHPVYPQSMPERVQLYEHEEYKTVECLYRGMTLRQWLVGQVLAGLALEIPKEKPNSWLQQAAENAVRLADAALAELEKADQTR